jgi:tight adherence protein C
MVRALGVGVLAAFVGWALVLSGVPWFRRRALVERMSPYVMGSAVRRRVGGWRGASTWRELIEPLAQHLGARLASAFGVAEPVGMRLRRVHSPLTVVEFRVRQLSWLCGGLLAGTVIAVGLRLQGGLAGLFILGGPLLGFLLIEQGLANESERWKRRVNLELPVVAEQVGMLLSAGYSLSAALNRLAQRGRGACGRDLGRLCERMAVGVGETTALREWAEVVDVPALHRLVNVLTLNRKAGDLGRLVSEEARSIRRDLHRQTLATMERRSQQVWIPVTVATLVPGVIFLAVPFVEALRMFSEA